MKKLIKKALDATHDYVVKTLPLTKTERKSLSIEDVKPVDLPKFMKDNNIPDDAYFDGRDNGYDAFDELLISWDVVVETTEEDKLKAKKQKFNSASFKRVYDELTNAGYKRVGANSAELNKFDSPYYMYINNDFDTLEKYYSLYFK